MCDGTTSIGAGPETATTAPPVSRGRKRFFAEIAYIVRRRGESTAVHAGARDTRLLSLPATEAPIGSRGNGIPAACQVLRDAHPVPVRPVALAASGSRDSRGPDPLGFPIVRGDEGVLRMGGDWFGNLQRKPKNLWRAGQPRQRTARSCKFVPLGGLHSLLHIGRNALEGEGVEDDAPVFCLDDSIACRICSFVGTGVIALATVAPSCQRRPYRRSARVKHRFRHGYKSTRNPRKGCSCLFPP